MLVLSGGIEVLYLAQSSALASESLRAEDIKVEIARLDENNQIIETEILSHSSLLTISSRAAELGFVKPKEFISLSNQDSIALKNE